MSNAFDQISASPLTWPSGWGRTPPDKRRRAKFTKGGRELSVAVGTDRVLFELKSLGVESGGFIVSSNLLLRNDGLHRSGQGEPRDPGVAVYWQLKGKPSNVMAIDHYDRVADNLGAIAATLEALRAVARHGGGKILERAFTGFTALPPPITTPPPRTCWQILGLGENASEEAINAAWRHKISEHHPDAASGNHDKAAELNAARDEALRLARA